MSQETNEQSGDTHHAAAPVEAGTHTPAAADVLLRGVNDVIAEWRALVRPQLWAQMPVSRLVDSLPDILPQLVRGARNGATTVTDDVKDLIADQHGSARREDAVPVTALAEEWQLLKEACRRMLHRDGVAEGERARLLDRLDMLMDDALGYTLRGYYREELDTLRGRGLERREREEDRRREEERQRADRRRGHETDEGE
jgi:hypothetical protein